MQVLVGATLAQAIKAATQHLLNHKETVNALNVFPVPDGDTGNNMAMTMEAAVKELDRLNTDSAERVMAAVARGSLLGARGNSGVILSQIFRGMARGLEGKETIDGPGLAEALQAGVETAYGAVMRPVEGTILSVARAAADAAAARAEIGSGAAAVLEAALAGAEEALARTPEQLPILKQAGVVDSGGKGLCYILAGAVAAVRGEVPVVDDSPPPVYDFSGLAGAAADTREASNTPHVEFELTDDLADIRYPYDMEFLLRGDNLPLDDIRAQIGQWGDSVLVVGSPDLAKVHIHSDQPGKVLDYCMQHGTLFDIEILNMAEQHAEIRRAAGLEAMPAASHAASAPAEAAPPAATGLGPNIVAVASGDGLADLCLQMGASQVVHGGQTMNPSTEDLVSAIYRCPADEVIVLPNNGNIVLAAQQARDIVTDKKVYVVPTKSLPQGLAALVSFQPGRSGEQNVRAMEQAIAAVRTGEVTFAVRDSQIGDLHIRAGDTLGLVDGEAVTAGQDQLAVLTDIVGRMVSEESSLLGLYYGLDVAAEEAEAAAAALTERFPDLEVEVHRGGQPLYAYLVSVE